MAGPLTKYKTKKARQRLLVYSPYSLTKNTSSVTQPYPPHIQLTLYRTQQSETPLAIFTTLRS